MPTPAPHINPHFQIFTAAELAVMTPDQIGQVLQQVTAVGQEINTRVVQFETQASALEAQITEFSTALTKEFGVADVAALDALRTTELANIEQLYQKLAAA